MRNESEQNRPRAVFARRTKEARERRNWTQQQLADRLAELGYPGLSRATLAKIEDPESTRSDVSIEDLFAIAAALDVAPVHLLVPLDDEATVQATPALPPVPAPVARQWIRGGAPLRVLLGLGDKDAALAFLTQLPEDELRRRGLAMGLNEDQIEDTLWTLEQGESAWLGGRPKIDSERFALSIEQDELMLNAKREALKRLKEREEQ